jgi:gliding-associated putative ABC transporter substrate-binding component GldG
MKKQTIITQVIIVVAIIVVANLLSNQLYLRLDFTEDKRYTLSKATRNILNDLNGVVTVTAYFSEDLPPQLLNNRRDFEDMLIEYEKSSGGNVVYQFVNPNEEQTKEQEVQQKGIGPIMINVRENDRVEQMRAYMGATLQMEEGTEIIPLIQPGASMEYDLTTSIKKLSIKDKPKVAILQGHGEAPLSAIPQLRQQLSVLYQVEEYTISNESIPQSYRAIAIIAPSDTIPQADLDKLSGYLDNGGKIFVAYSNVQGDLQQGNLSTSPDIGLVNWLRTKGVAMGRDFVVDAQCARVTVTQQQGFFRINSQKEFPFFPSVTNFEEHPVTKGLDQLTLTFVSSVTPISNDTTLTATRLMYTSENSGVQTAPGFINIQRKWNASDFAMGVQSLAAAVEGYGNGLGKLVVVGNGEFFSNGEGPQPRQVADDHVNFATNSIDWLADDTGLIDLRTKGITSRPLDEIEDGRRNVLKYGNVFAPIVLLLIYAFIRRLQNQRKRQKWMQGNFE